MTPWGSINSWITSIIVILHTYLKNIGLPGTVRKPESKYHLHTAWIPGRPESQCGLHGALQPGEDRITWHSTDRILDTDQHEPPLVCPVVCIQSAPEDGMDSTKTAVAPVIISVGLIIIVEICASKLSLCPAYCHRICQNRWRSSSLLGVFHLSANGIAAIGNVARQNQSWHHPGDFMVFGLRLDFRLYRESL